MERTPPCCCLRGLRECAILSAGYFQKKVSGMYNPQLDTFLCVADAGSFNKAAEELYISPPAVMKQLNLLENSLGLTLFVRMHSGLKLTEEGQSLYRDAKYSVAYCKKAVERAKDAGQKKENVIRVGVSPMTPAKFIQELWPKRHKLCPKIRFEFVPYENTLENAREILHMSALRPL